MKKNLSLQDIYDKHEYAIQDEFDILFNNILSILELDEDIELADDELAELVYDLINIAVRKL